MIKNIISHKQRFFYFFYLILFSLIKVIVSRLQSWLYLSWILILLFVIFFKGRLIWLILYQRAIRIIVVLIIILLICFRFFFCFFSFSFFYFHYHLLIFILIFLLISLLISILLLIIGPLYLKIRYIIYIYNFIIFLHPASFKAASNSSNSFYCYSFLDKVFF